MAATKDILRTPVTSSNIASIGYDPEDRTLAVEFTSGSVFHYSGVPKELHEALMEAPSKGTFFHKAVRGRFTSQSVPERRQGECPACGDVGMLGCVCLDCGCGNYSENIH